MTYIFANGSGTEADPYLVETAADLNGVRDYLSAHFKQTADIDLSVYENWEPIGSGDYNQKVKAYSILDAGDLTNANIVMLAICTGRV